MKHPASQAEQRIGALAADEPQDWFETKRKKTALNLVAVFFMLKLNDFIYGIEYK